MSATNPATKLFRTLTIDRAAMPLDEDKRTVEIAFASETPVARYDFRSGKEYDEVLDCGEGCDLSRLNNSHPLLLNHNTEKQIGVVENARKGDDRIMRAVVRFGSSELAKEIWQDVKDGIRRLVSVGYAQGKELSRDTVNGREAVRFSWLPYEVSIVPIPADANVGVGRAAETDKDEPITEKKIMTEPTTAAAPATIATRDLKSEQKEMLAIAKRWNKMDKYEAAIDRGASLDDFRAEVLNEKPATVTPLGLSEKEQREYSLTKAIFEAGEGSLSGLERELNDEIAKRSGKSARSFYLPFEVTHNRNQSVGTSSEGGYLVGTTNDAPNFIETLRAKMVLSGLGARFLTGLRDNLTIPKQTAASTVYWASEVGAGTESSATFGQLSLSPKAATAIVDVNKKLQVQSNPSIDALIRDDIAKQLALAFESVAINGGGSNEPTGIIQTAGIGSVAIGTNGGAPTYAAIVELESDIAAANADANTLAYLTHPVMRGKLKQVFTNATYGEIPLWNGMTMNGYNAVTTTQSPSGLTKGSSSDCYSILVGDFSQLILATWGAGVDVLVDPYTQGANRVIRVLADLYCDVGVRQAAAFSACLDARNA